MKTRIYIIVILISFLGYSQNIKTTSEVENLFLLEAERSVVKAGTSVNEKFLQFGEMNNQPIAIISENKKSMPAIYRKQMELSKMVGKDVYFNKMGLYLIAYKENSYISVYPKPLVELGKKEWTSFMFSNFYTTDKSLLKSITKSDIEEYAKEISKKAL